MPKGTHTGIRVALAVPPKLHEQLSAWAQYEGRAVASLCMFLIETSLRQAQRDGIAPSISHPGPMEIPQVSTEVVAPTPAPISGAREHRVSDAKVPLDLTPPEGSKMVHTTVAKKVISKEEKQEMLLQLLSELKG